MNVCEQEQSMKEKALKAMCGPTHALLYIAAGSGSVEVACVLLEYSANADVEGEAARGVS